MLIDNIELSESEETLLCNFKFSGFKLGICYGLVVTLSLMVAIDSRFRMEAILAPKALFFCDHIHFCFELSSEVKRDMRELFYLIMAYIEDENTLPWRRCTF